MKLLITGATGLVGRAIVEMAHKEGVVVHYLTTSRAKIVSNEIYQGFYWNPERNELDLKCFEGVTAIINLAGAPISKRWTDTYKKEICNSRVNAIKTLYGALSKIDSSNILSFVSASAIGIYPSSLNSLYYEGEEKVDQTFLGKVVSRWEKEIKTMSDFSFSIAKIRIGLVLASDGGALPQMTKPIKNYVGAAFGKGQQWQSWIHINDLAKMFMFVVNENLEGTFNGVGPNPVTNKKLVKALAKLYQVPLILPKIPKFIMELVLGEMAYLLFASQRVSSKKIAEEGFIFEHPNLSNALDNLLGSKLDHNALDTSFK